MSLMADDIFFLFRERTHYTDGGRGSRVNKKVVIGFIYQVATLNRAEV